MAMSLTFWKTYKCKLTWYEWVYFSKTQYHCAVTRHWFQALVKWEIKHERFDETDLERFEEVFKD